MRLKSLIRKSVPKVPTDSSGQQRRFAEAVSNNLDTLTGRRGNLIDRAVTFRDLIDVGVLKKSKSITSYGSNDGGDTGVIQNGDEDGVDFPTSPSSLTATGGFGVIQLNWSLSIYSGHDYVEIYRAQKTGAAIPTLSDAQAGGVFDRYYGDAYFYQDLRVGSNETYYYWVRAVNKNGLVSGFSNAANATTAIDYIHVSGLIDDILDDNVNTLGLNTALANASGGGAGTPAVWNSTTTYAKDKYVTHSGKIWKASQSSTNQTPSSSSSYWTEVGTYSVLADFVSAAQDQNVSTLSTLDTTYYTITETTNAITQATTNLASTSYVQTELADYTTTASLNLNYYTKTGADSAIATATTGLASQTYVQNQLGNYYTSAHILSTYRTETDTDTAISTAIGSYSTTVGGNTLTIEEQHQSIDGIEGKYSVKIDNNGNVAGFGLISTANTGVPTNGTGSAFIIAADRFAISADYNTSETALASVDKYPFKVFTANTTVNGEVIPAGVYIKDAYIHDAQITDAKIKDATITNAKIVGLEAGKITSGDIQITNSNDIKIYQGKTSYSSTSSGFWLGNLNGSAAFNIGDSTKYFKFDGGSGVFEATGAIIKDLSVETAKIADNAITVPDSQDFAAPSTEVKIGASSSAWTECVRMTIDWGSSWQDINSVLMFGRQRFSGVLGSRHLSGMQEGIYLRLNRINTAGNASSPRGQVWEAIDRPGRTVQYQTFAEFPAPAQQTESYIIEAYATFSGTASQGYWRREQAGIVLQASKK